MELDSKRIGSKIRKIREIKGLKQEYIAHAIGMSINGYSKMERGETKISIERLDQISKVLEMNLHDVIEFNDKTPVNFSQTNEIGKNEVVFNYSSENEKELLLQRIKDLESIISLKDELIKVKDELIEKLKS